MLFRSPLMNSLKERMSEPYKTLAKSFIILVGKLASAMGEDFKQYSKLIIQPLMYNLSDKQAAIRSETVTTMDKIANTIGPELILNEIGPILEKGNFEMRNALLIWMMKNSDSLERCDEKTLVKPLVSVLDDKSKEIRMLAEQLIKEVNKNLGREVFHKELKNTKANFNLQELMNKYKTVITKSVGKIKDEENFYTSRMGLNTTDNCKFNLSHKKLSLGKNRLGLNSSLAGSSIYKQRGLGERISMTNSTTNLKHIFEQKVHSKLIDFNQESRKIVRPIKNIKKKITIKNSLNMSKNNTINDNVVISTLGNKEKRNEVDKHLRWPIHEIQKNYIETLKKTLKNLINPILYEYMFSMESKNVFRAINSFIDGIKTEFFPMLDLFDLFSKWLIVKSFNQQNTEILKKLIEFFDTFLKQMLKSKYQMYDFEAAAIIPILCEKLGMNSILLKNQIKEMLRCISKLYNVSKFIDCVVWALENTRNTKSKLECLLLLKEFVMKHPVNEIFNLKNIKNLWKYVGSIDNSLRNESLEILSILYKSIGNPLWIMIDEIPEKLKIMLKKKLNSVVSDMNTGKNAKRSITPSIDLGTTLKGNSRTKSISRTRNNYDNSNIDELLKSNHPNNKKLESKYNNKVNETELCNDYPIENNKGVNKYIETLEDALEIIKNGEISKRVDALMYLNEKIISNSEEEKESLILDCNKIIDSFSEVLDEIFSNTPKDIPIRFAKYFMTVVSKICANELFVTSVSEDYFSKFAEQLLTKLLYDGLEKLGENNEGDYLVKALNSTMLKILEYYDRTKVFAVLINLFKRYRNDPPIIPNIQANKLPSLIVKCILKTTKTIETSIDSLDGSQIIIALHEYLLLTQNTSVPKSSRSEERRVGKEGTYGFKAGWTVNY